MSISLLGRIAAPVRYGLLLQTDSVGLSVMTVSPAKAAEPTVMPFGMLTQVGGRNHILFRGDDAPTISGTFWMSDRLKSIVKHRIWGVG